MRLTHNRRLGVLAAIGDAARIGKVEAVDFDQHRAAARGLLDRVRFDGIVDREFLHDSAIQRLEILQRELEEGELVALEILCQRKTERRFRRKTTRGQKLDPQIDIAIRLRPVAALVMQCTARTLEGQEATSKP
jgi:hypothetical protein